MPRFINPVPQYSYAAGGSLGFYTSETNDLITVYSDDSESTPIPNPVLLDEVGRVPSFFYSGVARVVLRNADGVQQWERDPVGSSEALGAFGQYSDTVIYAQNDFVYTLEDNFYRSRVNGNSNNDPDSTPSDSEFWEKIDFLTLYNEKISYSINEFCFESGKIYVSQVNNNLDNTPSSDSGDNWLDITDSRLSNYDNSVSIFSSTNVKNTLDEISVILDNLPLIRNFVDINEYGNNESGFADALADLNDSGLILVLDTKVPLVLTGNIQHTVEGMTILGGGSFVRGEYDKGGVIQITGTAESPIYLGSGATIENCVFYYPNQVLTATPTVYPATIKLKNESAAIQSQNPDIKNNVFVNSYIAIDTNGDLALNSAPAFLDVNGNRGCCINTFINHPYTLTECSFNFNNITYAWWVESVGQPIREYINDTGRGIVLGDVDGTSCIGNFFFGLGIGFKFESTSAITNLSSNSIDGCKYGIDFSDASVVGNLSITGGSILAKNPEDGTEVDCAGIYGRIGQTISGQVLAQGVQFGAANGNHIDIEQVTGNCFLRLNVDCDFYNMGRNDPGNPHYGILLVDTSTSAKLRLRGIIEDSINGSGSGFTAVNVSGCEMVDIDVMVEDIDTGISITSANAASRYRVSGFFKDVASELVTSGINTGQVQIGSLYTSDLPNLQNQVASAATLAIPNNTSRFFNVTGTTGITDIAGKREDREIVLKFNGGLTVTDGGNLSLNGNFSATANDTLTLACNGSTWFEVSRSAN